MGNCHTPCMECSRTKGFQQLPHDTSDDKTEQGLSTALLSCPGDSACEQISGLSSSERPSGAAKAASVLATWGWSKGNPGLLPWGQIARLVKSIGFLTG